MSSDPLMAMVTAVAEGAAALGDSAPPQRLDREMTDDELPALRDRAARGEADAVDQLIELAAERGDLDELRRIAKTGNATAADQFVDLVAAGGSVQEALEPR